MKYIITKPQKAREFEDLGDLTITKQFKTVPPYIEGAVLEQIDGGNWRLVDNAGRHIGAGRWRGGFCSIGGAAGL